MHIYIYIYREREREREREYSGWVMPSETAYVFDKYQQNFMFSMHTTATAAAATTATL